MTHHTKSKSRNEYMIGKNTVDLDDAHTVYSFQTPEKNRHGSSTIQNDTSVKKLQKPRHHRPQSAGLLGKMSRTIDVDARTDTTSKSRISNIKIELKTEKRHREQMSKQL